MSGGNAALSGTAVVSFGKVVPLAWWMPRKERAVLAIVSTFFWGASILQAASATATGASVLAFYGLGLLYVVCGMANLSGATRKTLYSNRRRSRRANYEQPQSLLQLFGILASMLIFNSIVLALYLSRGVSPTSLDYTCLGVATLTVMILTLRFGKQVFTHPFSRGWLALAFKAVPQVLLASMFVLHPATAQAFTVWSLGSLTLLATLRFWPSLLAFRRDTSSPHLRGLLLGETGNEVSILCMIAAWSWALIR